MYSKAILKLRPLLTVNNDKYLKAGKTDDFVKIINFKLAV